MTYDGKDLLEMAPEDRARDGVFMAFQYPVEIPGIQNGYFLKAALNALRKHRGEQELDAVEFMQFVRAKAKSLGMDQQMLSRSVNEGFSGGEKKRNEIFQMAVLEPRLAILDETDSGLDIDALKIVAEGVNALRSPNRAIVVVTHYQRLLDYIVPDFVHVLSGGRIVRSGGKELALELEAKGYGWVDAGSGGSEGIAMTAVAERHEALAAEFEAFRRDPAFGSGPRSQQRDAAFRRFLDRGFPTTRDEEWKFTSVAPIAALTFVRAAAASPARAVIEPFLFAGLGVNIVLVNGRLVRSLSAIDALPAGVSVRSSADGATAGEPVAGTVFGDLNAAFHEDEVTIDVAAKAVVSEPIHVLNLSTGDRHPALVLPRLRISAGEAAEVAVVESYAGAGDGQTLTCPVTTIDLAPRAVVKHVKIQRETSTGFHLANIRRPPGPRQHVHLVCADVRRPHCAQRHHSRYWAARAPNARSTGCMSWTATPWSTLTRRSIMRCRTVRATSSTRASSPAVRVRSSTARSSSGRTRRRRTRNRRTRRCS